MVVTVGEILADFVPEGKGHILRPGGAPSNVAVNLSSWGAKSAVIAKLGRDFLGKYLLDFVRSKGVDVSNVRFTREYRTGLVFVFLDKNGERDFTFYGAPSADTMLKASEISEAMIRKSSIVHFGSISTMYKNNKSATMRAVSLAKKYKKLVSYDPNVRLNLWEGRHGKARAHTKRYFSHADIIKLSDTELKFLFGSMPSKKSLSKAFGPRRLVFVSCGAKGCFVKYGDIFIHSPGIRVKAVDTTGAGDAFMAAVLYKIEKYGKGLSLNEEELVDTAAFANKKGADAVTRKGAV